MAQKRLFIVDAMALAFRSYHAFARGLSTDEGLPTHAVYGSLMFLINLLEKEKPDYFVIASDCAEPTFRHEMYDLYKANRTEMPEDLAVQIPYIYRSFEALGANVLKDPGLEADDLIGSLVTQFAEDDLQCFIVSGDKDFMQLIDSNTFLYSPKKGGVVKIVDTDGVKEKFGVTPDQVIDILALMGDSADNVPGVPGIGEKGAAKLIQAYGSLDGIYENLDKISNKRQLNGLTDNREKAELSKELVTIKTDADLKIKLDDCVCHYQTAVANKTLLSLAEELQFRTLGKKISDKIDKLPSDARETKMDPGESSSETENDNQQDISHENLSYQVINTTKSFEEFCQKWEQATVFAFDTETTGLDIAEDQPIGVSISWSESEAYYIPIDDNQKADVKSVLKQLKQGLENPLPLKIGHNLKFDIQMLRNLGIDPVGPFRDTMIGSYLLYPNQRQHNLDYCCLNYLGLSKIASKDLLGKSGTMTDVPLNILGKYACEDADYTLRLYNYLMPLIDEQELEELYSGLEMPLVPVLATMEQNGIFLDKLDLNQQNLELTNSIEVLTKSIYEIAGEEFNIRSTKQLQVILFEKLKVHEELGITRLKKTKSGYSTDASVLEKLKDHPLVEKLLDYRMLTKLKSTYVDTLPGMVSNKSNRLHASFHQTGTATGRLSSSDPNLQNIPIRSSQGRKIRRAFKAPSKEKVLIAADYSQIELRVLASLAKDPNLTEAFFNDADIHTSTAASIFGIPAEEVSSSQRNQAKAINFGIIYGMGPQRLARETGVSQKEAKEFIQKYFDTYPNIKKFIDDSIHFAKENEYTMTICRRKRPLPEINGTDRIALVNAQNMAVNTPVQGSAADLIKLAMVQLHERLVADNLDAKILLQVHDELVLECDASIADRVKEIVQESMETAMDIGVPLKVSIGVGSNWLEAH
ncbi:MAG: DNA polymerase I [Pseudobacteriovorax sp.]|nr:DNA polymerase I [Pseudobacteriovorax sp.]